MLLSPLSSSASHSKGPLLLHKRPPTSLGNLGFLPLELCDEIYRHVWRGKHFMESGLAWERRPKDCPTRTILGILRTSQQLSHEAMERLYAEDVFHFDLKHTQTWDDSFPEREKMRKIDLFLDTEGCNAYENKRHLQAVERTYRPYLMPFGRGDTNMVDCVVSIMMTSTKLSGYTGSTRIVACLSSGLAYFHKYQRVRIRVGATSKGNTDDSDWIQQMAGGLRNFSEDLRSALELSLGPSMSRTKRIDQICLREVVLDFHPQTFLEDQIALEVIES